MHNHSPFKAQNGSAASDIWFISFGDLLTLLVCFFLVLTPKDSLSGESPERNQGVSLNSLTPAGAGTKVADKGLRFSAFSSAIETGLKVDLKDYSVAIGGLERFEEREYREVLGLMPVSKALSVAICGEKNREDVISGVLAALNFYPEVLKRLSFQLLESCGDLGVSEASIVDRPQSPVAILSFAAL
jgi:hypothetical protein